MVGKESKEVFSCATLGVLAAVPIRNLGFVVLCRYSIRTPFLALSYHTEVHPITCGPCKAGVEVTLLRATRLFKGKHRTPGASI